MLLYSDEIHLSNPALEMFFNLFEKEKLPIYELLKFAARGNLGDDLKNALPLKDVLYLENMSKNKNKTKKQLIEFMKFEKQMVLVFNEGFQNLQNIFSKSFDDPEEFKKLINLVYQEKIKYTNIIGNTNDKNAITANYLSHLLEVLNNKEQFLLLDEKMSKMLFNLLIINGVKTSHYNKNKSKHVSFASNVLRDLPNFEHATFDELEGIKRDLNQYLKPFQISMKKLSNKIDTNFLDEEFAYYCKEIIECEIKPKVEEIKEISFQENIIKNIKKSGLEACTTTAAHGIFADGSISNGLLASAFVAFGVGNAIITANKQNKENKRNSMYFYKQVQTKLEKEKDSFIIY